MYLGWGWKFYGGDQYWLNKVVQNYFFQPFTPKASTKPLACARKFFWNLILTRIQKYNYLEFHCIFLQLLSCWVFSFIIYTRVFVCLTSVKLFKPNWQDRKKYGILHFLKSNTWKKVTNLFSKKSILQSKRFLKIYMFHFWKVFSL